VERNSHGSRVHEIFRPQNCGAVLRTSAHDQVRRGRSKIITFFQWVLVFAQSVNHARRPRWWPPIGAAATCTAKDGQILISGRVAAAVEKAVPLEDLGSLALKGLSQPVSAFNVPLAATQPALRVIEGGPPSV
jgi:hypothetical protein